MRFDDLAYNSFSSPMSYEQMETEAHILGMSVDEYRTYLAAQNEDLTIRTATTRRAHVGKNTKPKKAKTPPATKAPEISDAEKRAFAAKVAKAKRESLEYAKQQRRQEYIEKMLENRATQVKTLVPYDEPDYIKYQELRNWPMLITFTDSLENLVEIFSNSRQVFIDARNGVVFTSTQSVEKWTVVTGVLQLSPKHLNTVIMCPIKIAPFWDVTGAAIATDIAETLKKSCRVMLQHPYNPDGSPMHKRPKDRTYVMDIGALALTEAMEKEADMWNMQKLGKFIIVQFAYPSFEFLTYTPTLPEIAAWLGKDFWDDITDYYVRKAVKFPSNTPGTQHVYSGIRYNLPTLMRYTKSGELYHMMYHDIAHFQWYTSTYATVEDIEESFRHHLNDDTSSIQELYRKFGLKIF